MEKGQKLGAWVVTVSVLIASIWFLAYWVVQRQTKAFANDLHKAATSLDDFLDDLDKKHNPQKEQMSLPKDEDEKTD